MQVPGPGPSSRSRARGLGVGMQNSQHDSRVPAGGTTMTKRQPAAWSACRLVGSLQDDYVLERLQLLRFMLYLHMAQDGPERPLRANAVGLGAVQTSPLLRNCRRVQSKTTVDGELFFLSFSVKSANTSRSSCVISTARECGTTS